VKALIVDSDLAARGTLRRALESIKDIEVVKECPTINDAISAGGSSDSDLWFIESWLPGCGACYLAGSLDLEPYLVEKIESGNGSSAHRAMSLKTICLQRPVDRIRLTEAVDLLYHLDGRSEVPPTDEPVYKEANRVLARMPSKNGTLMVHSEEGVYVFMKPRQIRWIDGAGRCTRLYLKGRIVHCRDSLNCLQEKLDSDVFLKVHTSIVVNTEHIQDVVASDSGGLEIVMTDGHCLRVHRAFREQIVDLFEGTG
jgi:two-component system LytT family response regulator